MLKFLYTGLLLALFQNITQGNNNKTDNKESEVIFYVDKTGDFEITGNVSSENWERAQWLTLNQRSPSSTNNSIITTVKALYSQTGIYLLFHCQDSMLTTTMDADFLDLWKEDDVKVFLWPDESIPAYFEYELSPLNYELAILVSNINGELYRWQPFHYEADRQAKHVTVVEGGEKKSFARVRSWTAEFFIPYMLLRPLKNINPKEGTKWKANFYRVDYDDGHSSWLWQSTSRSFHDYEKFGTLVLR